MDQDLSHTIALLERTPAALDALLRGLPDAWTHANEGGDTWNAPQIVGHLIHGERTDWMPRARIILESGEARTFEPFDREGYAREARGKSLPQLLDEFTRLRRENVAALRHVGGARPHPPPPALTDAGPPVPRGGGPVEPVPRRPPM